MIEKQHRSRNLLPDFLHWVRDSWKIALPVVSAFLLIVTNIPTVLSVGAFMGRMTPDWLKDRPAILALLVLGTPASLVVGLYVRHYLLGKARCSGILLDMGPDHDLVQFRLERNGTPISEPMSRKVMGKARLVGRLESGRDLPMSLAMSADGRVLATLTGQHLIIWTVKPRTGRFHRWKEAKVSDCYKPRVVAIAGKGQSDAWIAFTVNEDQADQPALLRQGTFTDLKLHLEPIDEIPDSRRATHAVFFQGSLIYDASTIRKISSGGAWVGSLENKRVIALDAARVGGSTYLAVLTRSEVDGAKGTVTVYHLIVGRADGGTPPQVRELPQRRLPPKDVTVVRAPNEPAGSLCVLVDMNGPTFPFGRPLPASRQVRSGKRRLLSLRSKRSDTRGRQSRRAALHD